LPLDTVFSVCPHDCPSACALEVERIDGNRDRPHSRCAGAGLHRRRGLRQGRPLCRAAIPSRAAFGAAAPGRRQGRRSTAYEPISWDDALDLVAEGLTRAAQRHGSEAVWPHYYSGTMGLVQRDGLQRLRHAMRYSRQHSTICNALTDAGWLVGVGTKRGVDGREMAKSDLIVVWGGNPVSTQVNVMTHIAKARKERGAKLVVIDPYRTGTAEIADMHLAPLPGTDGALACAVMHVLFKEGYADRAYLARYTDDPEGLEAHLETRPRRGPLQSPGSARPRSSPSPGSTANQARLSAHRLWLFALAERRGAIIRGGLPAGGDRRLAVRGRRRAAIEPRPRPPRPQTDRRHRSDRPFDPHPRSVAHRANPHRRHTRSRRWAAGDGAPHPEHQPDGGVARVGLVHRASRATISLSACTSSS
jgi:hypothetical protein